MEINDKDTSTLGLLFNEAPLLIRKQLAVRLGLNEAIVLQQIHFHIQNKYRSVREKDRARDFYFREGTFWTYNGYKDWQAEEFPFWSVRTVERTFTNLEKAGILRSGFYNDRKSDRKKWYTINYEKLIAEEIPENPENLDTEQSANLADSDVEQSATLADSDAKQSATLAESNPPNWQDPICQNGGFITKTNKEVFLDSSSSRDPHEKIDSKLRSEFPNVPFDEVKEKLLKDPTAIIKSENQYESMLRYRLQNYRPKQEFKKPQPKGGASKKPVRTEILPDWFDEEKEKRTTQQEKKEDTPEEIAAKKKEIDEILAKFRTS